MWLITVHALAVLAYANWANKVLSAPRCYESVVKSKALPSKCIHYSWSVICLQRACSKRQYSNCFSYSSAKDISTTAQNASLSDTVSLLEKESQPTGSLVSLEGIRFLFSCRQTIKSQRAPCQGCFHQAPLRQARHTWPPGHSQSPRGLWTWWGFAHPSALWGTLTHCLGLFHMPSLPVLFPISVSSLYCCSHSPAPHLLLFRHDSSFPPLAMQSHCLTVLLIFAKCQLWQSDQRAVTSTLSSPFYR